MAKKRGHRNPGVAYQKALDQLEVAERRLSLAFTRWKSARRALFNADGRLNRKEEERA